MNTSRIFGIIAVIGGILAQAAAMLSFIRPGLAAILSMIALFIAGGTERIQGQQSAQPPQDQISQRW